MDQMNLLENRFSSRKDIRELCSVSAQHYIFAVKAFANLVKRLSFNEYEFTFRETRTYEIISDVAQMRLAVNVPMIDCSDEVHGESQAVFITRTC